MIQAESAELIIRWAPNLWVRALKTFSVQGKADKPLEVLASRCLFSISSADMSRLRRHRTDTCSSPDLAKVTCHSVQCLF